MNCNLPIVVDLVYDPSDLQFVVDLVKDPWLEGCLTTSTTAAVLKTIQTEVDVCNS